MALQFDANTANLIAGLLFLAMPIAVWTAVGGQRPRVLQAWSLGGLFVAAYMLLLSLRPVLPAWLAFEVTILFGFAGPMALAEALRTRAHRLPDWTRHLRLLAAAMAVEILLRCVLGMPVLRIAWVLAVQGALVGGVAWNAWRLGRSQRSRSAFVIAGFFAVLALLLAWRLMRVALGAAPPQVVLLPGVPAPDLLPLTMGAILTCIFTNVALIALLLEQARREEVLAVARHAEAAERQRLAGQIAHLERRHGLGQMAGSLGHEINQPLTAILSNAQLLERGLREGSLAPQDAVAVAARVVANTRRASQIVERIRSYIRPTRSGSEPVDLARLAQDVADLVGEDARRHGVTLELRLGPVPVVRGNAVELSQVVLNLCRNAIQAMSAGTRRQLCIVVAAGPGAVELRVEDSGPGLAPEALARAGEAFFTTKADGLGLGLSIARDIARRWGGELLLGNGTAGAVARLRMPVRGAVARLDAAHEATA